MNKADMHKITVFPSGLDDAVNERFPGAKCTTGFSIIEMTHITKWKRGHKKAREIKSFVAGFIAGNRELANRLATKAN